MKTGSPSELIFLSAMILSTAFITSTWFSSPNIAEYYEHLQSRDIFNTLRINMYSFEYYKKIGLAVWGVAIFVVAHVLLKGVTKNALNDVGLFLLFFIIKPWLDLYAIQSVGGDASFSWLKYILLVVLAFVSFALALGIRSDQTSN